MTDRSGVEIDYCPKCRGVWLDRGELDKIIERSEAAPSRRGDDDDDDRRPRLSGERFEDPRRESDDRHAGKRRKRGFLSELFEFGDD